MASGLAIYASQGGLLRHHARLASGRRLRSAGWDWPTGFLRKVFVHDVMKIPLPQALLGATFFSISRSISARLSD